MKELADLYARGLRQVGLPVREALDLTLREGVKGNVTMAQALEVSELIDELAESAT